MAEPKMFRASALTTSMAKMLAVVMTPDQLKDGLAVLAKRFELADLEHGIFKIEFTVHGPLTVEQLLVMFGEAMNNGLTHIQINPN